MKRLILLVALISMISAAGAETPYGCYKNLRWGMNPAETRTILAAKETSTATKDNVLELYFGSYVSVSNHKLSLTLYFRNEKLFKVNLDFPPDDPRNLSCASGSIDRVSAYKIYKEALIRKYGKPIKDLEENKNQSQKMEDAICQQSGRMGAGWETANSKITLSAELLMVRGGKPVFAPLLVYIDKAELK